MITGGTGLIGHALLRVLADDGFGNVIAVGSRDCDLRDGELYRSYNLDKLAAAGFQAKITLEDGIRQTYEWYSASWKTARHQSRI